MKNLKIFSVLFLIIAFGSCKEEVDKYAEYREKPHYIINPTPAQKEYFDAYDKTLQKWGVEYEEFYIPTSKGIAHVTVSGPKNGVPVLLLHGMSASSTMWYPNAKALAKDYRLFAVDLLIEPGKSYKTADLENLDEVVAWYQEILWALKLDSYHLIGTSRGGWLATSLALRSKRDIRSMILLGPVQTFEWIPPSKGMLKNIMNVFYSKEERIDRSLETFSVDPNKLDENYVNLYRIGTENDTLNKFLIQMKPFSSDDLQTLKMPVLVLVGDDDMFSTQKTIKITEKYLPRGKGEIISNAGHFLTVDQAQVVNKKMLEFLKSVDDIRKKK